MTTGHLIQYAVIAVIVILVAMSVIKRIRKMRNCNSPEDVCQCCSSKSICGKAKKSSQDVANSKK